LKSLRGKLPSSYLKVKTDELHWLSEYSGSKLPSTLSSWTFEDLLKFKIKARENIHRKERGFLGESLIPEIELPEIGGLRFNYDYQRVRFQVLNKDPGKIFYPSFKASGLQQHIYLVQSCQAAVTQLLEAAKRSYGDLKIWHPFHAYHETLRYFSSFGWEAGKEKISQNNLLLLDSSTFRDEDDIYSIKVTSKTKAVIFDTTCLDRTDPEIHKIIKHFTNQDVPVILMRSSLKLDSLGMEFGRFGHVLFICDKTNKKFSEFMDTYHELNPFFGNNISSRQIYPFLNDKSFQKLNSLWVNRVQTSNAIFREKLESELHSLGHDESTWTFAHNLFLWLQLFGPLEKSNDVIKSITQQLLFSGVPLIATSSFPWDGIALTAFYSTPIEGPMRKRVLRISFGDFDKDTAEEFTETVVKIFKVASKRSR
jgi:hypothetical protein